MADTTAPILTGLDLPSLFDLSGGSDRQAIVARAADPGGEGVDRVVVYLDRPVYLYDNVQVGWTDRINVDGLFSGDRFGDATPDSASRALPMWHLTHSGDYTVTKVAVIDKAGNREVYSNGQLQAMGFDTGFTVKGGLDDATAPTLLALALPDTLDLASGQAALALSGRLADNPGGSGVTRMDIQFDRPLTFEHGTSDRLNINFAAGAVTPGQPLSFDDDYVLTNATPAGSYRVASVTLHDLAGNTTTYSAAQLQALGIDTGFKVTGSTAPEPVPPPATLTDEILADGYALSLATTAWTGSIGDADSFRVVIRYDASESSYVGATLGAHANGSVTATVSQNGAVATVTITGSGRFTPGDALRVEMRQLKDKELSVYDVQEFSVNGVAQLFPEAQPHRWVLSGSDGDDVLRAEGDAQMIDGGAGVDIVDFGMSRDEATVTRTGERIEVATVTGRHIALENVERLVFMEDYVDFAPDGVAAQTWRLYRAAFDRVPDKEGLGYWISQVEHGLGRQALAGELMASSEFGPTQSTHAFVTMLYRNVLDREPDPGGYAWWTAAIDQHGVSRQQVMLDFADSPENIARVVGETANGIEYTFW